MAGVGFFILGSAAWLGGLAAAPMLALWFWNRAPKYVPNWAAHLLFVPVLLVVEWLLVQALFYAAHDDGNGPPGLGFALIPQVLLLFGTLAIYYAGVAIRTGEAIWLAINDR